MGFPPSAQPKPYKQPNWRKRRLLVQAWRNGTASARVEKQWHRFLAENGERMMRKESYETPYRALRAFVEGLRSDEFTTWKAHDFLLEYGKHFVGKYQSTSQMLRHQRKKLGIAAVYYEGGRLGPNHRSIRVWRIVGMGNGELSHSS